MRFLRAPVLTVLFVGTVVTRAALGQEPAMEYPAPCDASKMSRADVDRAHTVFLSGKQFLEESNYDKAISYFKDAYTIDCSIHAILPIIATAYERKGDKPAAIRALDEYLKRAPNAPDHDVIERRIKNLTDQLAHEPAPAPAATAPLAPSPSPTAVAPTSPAPTATAPAAPPPALASPPADAATARRSPGAGPWVVVGIGGAAIVSSIVFYAIGVPEVASAADSCPTRKQCPTDIAQKGNDGRALETLGGVAGAVGLAAVGGGILWYALSPKGEHGVTARLSVVPGYAGLEAAGTF